MATSAITATMEIMAERPLKLARSATAPIPCMLLPAPPPEAHINNRCRAKRDLQIDKQRMDDIFLRNRRTRPAITTSNDEDKESSTESGEGVAPISGDGEESQGTYDILNHIY